MPGAVIEFGPFAQLAERSAEVPSKIEEASSRQCLVHPFWSANLDVAHFIRLGVRHDPWRYTWRQRFSTIAAWRAKLALMLPHRNYLRCRLASFGVPSTLTCCPRSLKTSRSAKFGTKPREEAGL